jgi:hypothetical protein
MDATSLKRNEGAPGDPYEGIRAEERKIMLANKETSGWLVGWLPYFPILTVILIVVSIAIIWAFIARGRDIIEGKARSE